MAPAKKQTPKTAVGPQRQSTETQRAWRGAPLWELNLLGDAGAAASPLRAVHELVEPGAWDVIVDVRSEDEYALDHLPGAINRPVLDNAERIAVGTLHSTDSFEARRLGAGLVAKNLAAILTRPPFGGAAAAGGESVLGRDARVLVYCWRGGERSGALAQALWRIGWHVTLLAGGWKSYRRCVMAAMEGLGAFEYAVVGGPTGVGKGQVLDELRAAGAQVLDLEGLAHHYGSILGFVPAAAGGYAPQPSQKAFETRVAVAFAALDPARPVFVEGEGKRIGVVETPRAVHLAMRAAPRVSVTLDRPARVARIRRQYAHFEGSHVAELLDALGRLTEAVGHKVVDRWAAQVEAGEWDAFVDDLLERHYDPGYAKAAARDHDAALAPPIVAMPLAEGGADEAYRELARALVAWGAARKPDSS